MATRQIAVADSFSRDRVVAPKRHLDDFSRHGLEFASVAMGVTGFVMFVDAMTGHYRYRGPGHAGVAVAAAVPASRTATRTAKPPTLLRVAAVASAHRSPQRIAARAALASPTAAPPVVPRTRSPRPSKRLPLHPPMGLGLGPIGIGTAAPGVPKGPASGGDAGLP